MQDLKPGMELEGVVTNVTAFGAFVDIGVHQDGLVHVSQLADRFIKDPSEAVKVGEKIHVRVLEVDLDRKRISLTAKKGGAPAGSTQGAFTKPQPGQQPNRGGGGGDRPGGGGGGGGGGGRQNTQQQQKPAAGPGFKNNPFADHFRK